MIMSPRSITVYKAYQLSTHKTLGFFTGEEDSVSTFCSLKFRVEEDDIALERIPVKQVTKSELICFREVLGQIRSYTERIKQLEEEADEAGIKEDIVEAICKEDIVLITESSNTVSPR